ncbi:MAG: hypothetical protein JO034_28535 [Singulisphaera sp.]|nr:hypothetical protein [Singulisphaera sp.]
MSSLNLLIVAALAASALALTLVAPRRSRRLARLRAAQEQWAEMIDRPGTREP